MAPRAATTRKHPVSTKIGSFFIGVYEISRFIILFFKETFIPPYEFREVVQQFYKLGYKSLPLISVTAFITGMVFTAHSRPSLSDFGATSWLPSLTGVAIIKALAPLISALICAGKSGSQIAAELASMKVTQQIDAMEVSAVNPFKFLAVTRILATTFMMPLLMLYSALMGLIGSFLDITLKDQTSFILFIHDVFLKLGYAEILSSLIRSFVYGFTIGVVGCYKGFSATNGTAGVGKAANSAVVTSMFLIFIEEIVIVKVFNPFYVK
jgi:phospholipid/cholesterol/gamma-HCH transport system permease protein